MKIYTVTTLRELNTHGRTVGYFSDMEEAQEAVERNSCDIYESGYYPYAVVEEVEDGLYPYCPKAQWYQWNGGRYVKIPKPEGLKHVVNFSIG